MDEHYLCKYFHIFITTLSRVFYSNLIPYNKYEISFIFPTKAVAYLRKVKEGYWY